MARKFFTLIIAQPEQSKVRKISVPHSVFYALTFAAFVGVAAVIIFLASFTQMAIEVGEFNRISTELQRLKSENQNYLFSTAQLVDKISFLEVLTQKLSVAALLEKNPRKMALAESEESFPIIDLKKVSESSKLPARERLQLLGAGVSQLEARVLRLENYFNDQYFKMAYTPSIWPVIGWLSDKFGKRENSLGVGEAAFHRGIDISTAFGNCVLASADGTVVSTEQLLDYGNIVVIDHGFGISTCYAHLAGFNVRQGERVKRGEVIGFVGNTGRTTGPHLHYEVRIHGNPVNPVRYVSKPS
jgi:murein DD-endopeptidase MepM/ murein hydrolase activator NlpD